MADIDLNESNGRSLMATAVLFLVLTWISVGLRCYVRTVLTNSFQLDDWLMMASQLVFTLTCAFVLQGYRVGLGHHNASFGGEDDIPPLKWQALAAAMYILCMMFIKLCIGIFLLRLAVKKLYKRIIWGSLVVVAIWSIAIFFWNLFQCRPLEAQWDYTIPDLKCITGDQLVAAAYAMSVMTVVSDWFYALIPIPMLWDVKMTKQAKITVMVVLSLGIFASVATLVRLRYLAALEETDDILFVGTDVMVWSLTEPGVAIIASSLATIRPLLRVWRVRGFESTGPSGGHSAALPSGANTSMYMTPYPKNDTEAQPIRSHDGGRVFDDAAERLETSPQHLAKERRREAAKSGIFIIEGDRVREPWVANTIASQSSGSVHVQGHDAHGHDTGEGYVGTHYKHGH